MSTAIDWIQAAEKRVGANHPTLPDIVNRPLRQYLQARGWDDTGVISEFALFEIQGANGDGVTDNTSIWQSEKARAILKHPGGCTYTCGSGTFRFTGTGADTFSFRSGDSFLGAGSKATTIAYDPAAPTADNVCWRVGGGSQQALNCRIRGVGFYSANITDKKIALELWDISSCMIQDIYIWGAGTGTPAGPYWTGGAGTGSIGIRIRGREVSNIDKYRIVADSPIYIDFNPNTLPTDGEELDHFHFSNGYTVALGHYHITCNDGLGIMQCEWDGYQAWAGGTGGFYMNDTRVSPVVPSRGISFKNIRGEQGTDVNGYWFNVAATTPILDFRIERCFLSVNTQGIKVAGFMKLVIDQCVVATATGKNSLLVSGGIGGSVVVMDANYFQPGSLYTLTGFNLVRCDAWESATEAGPGTAVYAVTRNDTEWFAERGTLVTRHGGLQAMLCATEEITLATGALTTDSVANLLPVGAIIEAVGAIVTVAITGPVTSWKVGDATTAARFVPVQSTLTANFRVLGGEHLQGGVASNAAGSWQAAAAKARITCIGQPTGGKIRLEIWYRQFTAPFN